MDKILTELTLLAIIGALGLAYALARRGKVDWRWLAMALALAAANDLALTRFYGVLPELVPGASWNWTGKALALALTLGLAALPVFGWRAVGLTLIQKREGRWLTWAVALLLAVLFTVPALLAPADRFSGEDLAFQLTMPGLEEEGFFRGLFLLALGRAFRGRWRFAGIDWNWGMIISSVAFGLGHALGWDAGAPTFDPMTFALTGVPALALVWLRERSGSLVLPILLHNWVNCASYLL